MKSLRAVIVIASLAGFATLTYGLTGQSTGQKQPAQQSKDQTGKKPGANPENGDDQAIKLGTDLVTVPFSVTDKRNAYINDLKKEDVEILEDNKPQKIFSFERQTGLPITIAMLIDISGSENNTLVIEKSAGSRFLSKVIRPDKDLAAIVTFESEAVLVQDLTSNVSRLQSALTSVRPAAIAANVGSVTGTPPIIDSKAGSTALYDAIYSVSSDLLRREAGRRVIILITDGVDTSSQLKLKQAIEAAWRSEVIVYSIGIGDPGFDGIDSGVLKRVADQTGGRAYFPKR
ncbi:MAG: VWA domain-containing protein, partial [Blastocatellia bacterium]